MELDQNYGRKKIECEKEFIGCLVGNEDIKLIDLINCGSFGDIYLGQSQSTSEYWAIKFIKSDSNKKSDYILKEYNIMKKIESKGKFPKSRIEFSNQNKAKATILIMEHLGPNIYELFKLCNRKFSPATVAHIAIEALKRLEELHKCGFVHRDLKPENFCLGGDNLTDVYLIDFGLSAEFVRENGTHIDQKQNSGFVGTPRYASRNSHLGFGQGRRDDIESLGYLCVFLIEGSLPWQTVKHKDKKLKHKELNLQKENIDIKALCREIPEAFCKYLELARSLQFKEEPDYKEFIDLLKPIACELQDTDWLLYSEVLLD